MFSKESLKFLWVFAANFSGFQFLSQGGASPGEVVIPPSVDNSNHGAPNTINLVAVNDSSIVSVSLYSNLAEVSRLFKFEAKIGYNNVVITGLPTSLKPSSVGVEGRGAGTIHDVTVVSKQPPITPTTSPSLTALKWQRQILRKEYDRLKASVLALNQYMNGLKPENTDIYKVTAATDMYLATAGKVDTKILELERDLTALDEKITLEVKGLRSSVGDSKLLKEVRIGVFAERTAPMELLVKYAVGAALWNPVYELRVDMENEEKAVRLVYQAAITQFSGESWDNVPLTLETASPTYSLEVPKLRLWNVGTSRSTSRKRINLRAGQQAAMLMMMSDEEDTESMPEMAMASPVAAVTSKGNLIATFQIPGRIKVPSDHTAHKVTIVELDLNATLKRIAVPKENPRVHLTAKIKNASEFTLLPGEASVYINGSFISKSNIPAVNPQESFAESLGLDPSVRITYHPLVKHVSQSGFYSKTSEYVYTQRITIFNAKSVPVDELVVLDQIPVSQDSQVTIKLVSPALPMAPTTNPPNVKSNAKPLPAPIQVAEGVTAEWDAGDAENPDVEALGKDGMVKWVCAVPALETIHLTLRWEVSIPAELDGEVVGLN